MCYWYKNRSLSSSSCFVIAVSVRAALFSFHLHPPTRAMAATVDDDVVSEGPSEDFWQRVDEAFLALDGEEGEEDNNLWWVQRPTKKTDFKLVLQPSIVKGYHARAMRHLLDDDARFVGGTFMVNLDTLIILYLRQGVQLDEDTLEELVERFDAAPFVPFYHTSPQRRRVWQGNSDERDSWCDAVY